MLLGLFCIAVYNFNPNLLPSKNSKEIMSQAQTRTEFDIAISNVQKVFGEILRGYKQQLGDTHWPNFFYRLQPPEVSQGLTEFYDL